MDFIAIVLGILVMIVPVVAKAIEKSLARAGKQGGAEKARRVRELFETDKDSGKEEVFPTSVIQPESEPDSVMQPVAQAAGRSGEPVRSINVRPQPSVGTAVFQDPDSESGRKLEIDPKKLIIYSEIMKPKFRDSF